MDNYQQVFQLQFMYLHWILNQIRLESQNAVAQMIMI